MKFIVGTNQHNEIYSDKCGVLVSGKASDEIKHFIDKINKLEAENSKLRKCVEKNIQGHQFARMVLREACFHGAADDMTDYIDLAYESLKELENK